LNSVEKLRRVVMLWNTFYQAGFHLIALSYFWGPLPTTWGRTQGLKISPRKAVRRFWA